MRLLRRLQRLTAGEREACRCRYRVPWAGCRLWHVGCTVELRKAIAPVRNRRALPLARSRHLKPYCGRYATTDLWYAPPVKGCGVPTFCLSSRLPCWGHPGARRAGRVAEGAAGGVDGTGARARRTTPGTWLAASTAATAELRERRLTGLQVDGGASDKSLCSFTLVHAWKREKVGVRPHYMAQTLAEVSLV